MYRIMALSKKLTATDEQIACDQLYLSKVSVQLFSFCYLSMYIEGLSMFLVQKMKVCNFVMPKNKSFIFYRD
jgi:hypothetical protein